MALQDVYEPVLDPELSALWDRYEEARKIAHRAERRGERRGIVKGELQGIIKTIQGLLSQRFGPLPTQASTYLQQATLQDLEGIQSRVLTAATLEEALGLAKK